MTRNPDLRPRTWSSFNKTDRDFCHIVKTDKNRMESGGVRTRQDIHHYQTSLKLIFWSNTWRPVKTPAAQRPTTNWSEQRRKASGFSRIRHLLITWCPHWSEFNPTILREKLASCCWAVMDVMSLWPSAGFCCLGSITIKLQKSTTQRAIDRWIPQTHRPQRGQREHGAFRHTRLPPQKTLFGLGWQEFASVWHHKTNSSASENWIWTGRAFSQIYSKTRKVKSWIKKLKTESVNKPETTQCGILFEVWTAA